MSVRQGGEKLRIDRSPIRSGMGVAVVMVEKRPSWAEKEPRRGDLSPDRGGRGRAAASI